MDGLRMARTAVLGVIVLGAGMVGGCNQKNLFAEQTDPAEAKIRYWHGDSVRAERERRRENQDVGLGFPTGPTAQ